MAYFVLIFIWINLWRLPQTPRKVGITVLKTNNDNNKKSNNNSSSNNNNNNNNTYFIKNKGKQKFFLYSGKQLKMTLHVFVTKIFCLFLVLFFDLVCLCFVLF